MLKYFLSVLTTFFALELSTFGNIKLPGIISDNMILQRNLPIKIWGWGDAGEKIKISFKNQDYSAVTDPGGKWIVIISPSDVGGPYDMQISGKNSIIIKNILMGDVWVCSGQSNMEWKMSWLKDQYKDEMATANFPDISLIDVANEYDVQVRQDAKINKSWASVNSENLPDFSAVAYFFAKNLYEKYKVPIGLISSEWGGTVAEAWMSYEGLSGFPNYINSISELRKQNNEEIIKSAKEKYLIYKNALIEKDKPSREWIKPTYKASDWKKMKLPGLWETYGLNMDGIIVFRKEITLKKQDLNKEFILTIPAVDDVDTTFINGKIVGTTNGYDKQRKYIINPKILVEGINVVIIKVYDTSGGGGVYG